jgi:hypothetical protein
MSNDYDTTTLPAPPPLRQREILIWLVRCAVSPLHIPFQFLSNDVMGAGRLFYMLCAACSQSRFIITGTVHTVRSSVRPALAPPPPVLLSLDKTTFCIECYVLLCCIIVSDFRKTVAVCSIPLLLLLFLGSKKLIFTTEKRKRSPCC